MFERRAAETKRGRQDHEATTEELQETVQQQRLRMAEYDGNEEHMSQEIRKRDNTIADLKGQIHRLEEHQHLQQEGGKGCPLLSSGYGDGEA
jgi:chromosome segregation ATPase